MDILLRDVNLSTSRYFNQRLLNYKQRFASDSEYIFYAHSVLQHSALNSNINIAMKKVKGSNLTAGMFSKNFKETVKSFIASDDAFSFMSSIKGTPAYWKRFLLEVLAMVKQLGLPTFLTKEEYIEFIDGIVKAELPNKTIQPELYELVKTYQIHSHSKSCRKYKNVDCRYSFGRFFTDRTIIAEPLPKEMSQEEKEYCLQNRAGILNKVKEYIDTSLDPRKINILSPGLPNYQEIPSIEEILLHLEITPEEYYNALSISSDNDFQIHLKRAPNSCFVNNYFSEGLMAWQANIDIQPVINHYKAVAYMCIYFSKSEDECSQSMKQAAKQASEMNLSCYERMKSIARAYITSRECSVQEAVYHVMPELWLRKTFPGVVFANSNLPENRYKMCKNEEKMQELENDSTDIYKRNMLDRYIDRPNNSFNGGKYARLNNICFAEFLSQYYLAPKKVNDDNKNDSQPEVLQDDMLENNNTVSTLPDNVPLMSSKEKLKCRKVKSVLRYHVPHKYKYPEKYAHHLLFMFYPFRNEQELCNTSTGTYLEKLNDPEVLCIINENKAQFEPYGDMVDVAFSQIHLYGQHNQDPTAQQENDEVREMLGSSNDDEVDEDANENDAVLFDDQALIAPVNVTLIPDSELNSNIRSLNERQRDLFEVVNKWARDIVKNLSSKFPKTINPLHIFVTGGGGCGKSHLVKTIYHSLQKTFSFKNGDPEKARVTLLAPTGVAAVNIDGTTVHSGLGIPVGHNGKCVYQGLVIRCVLYCEINCLKYKL